MSDQGKQSQDQAKLIMDLVCIAKELSSQGVPNPTLTQKQQGDSNNVAFATAAVTANADDYEQWDKEQRTAKVTLRPSIHSILDQPPPYQAKAQAYIPGVTGLVPHPEVAAMNLPRPGARLHFILTRQFWTYYHQTKEIDAYFGGSGQFTNATVKGHLVSGCLYHLTIDTEERLDIWSNSVHFPQDFRMACDRYINEQRLSKELDPLLKLHTTKGKKTKSTPKTKKVKPAETNNTGSLRSASTTPEQHRGWQVVNKDILTAIMNRAQPKDALKMNSNNIMNSWKRNGVGSSSAQDAQFSDIPTSRNEERMAGDRIKLIHELMYRYQAMHETVLSTEWLNQIQLDMISIGPFKEKGTPRHMFTKGERYLGSQLEVLPKQSKKRKW